MKTDTRDLKRSQYILYNYKAKKDDSSYNGWLDEALNRIVYELKKKAHRKLSM